MKTITQMREEIKGLMEELGKMKAQCVSENRSPNGDECKRAEERLNQIDELEKQIALQERIESTEERLSKPKTEPTRPEVKESARNVDEQR